VDNIFTILDSPEDVAAAAASDIANALREGARSLVLAGGTTPQRCYELLSQMDIEWGRVTILFGDERCVRPDHPDSNYRMARETLLDRVSPATVHRMPAELGPDEGAGLYAHIVASVAPLDIVTLGVGEDGHTASLFTGHPALKATALVVGIRDSPKPPPQRVTMTLPALQRARRVIILATGAGKADAVARAKQGEVPSGMIEIVPSILSADVGRLAEQVTEAEAAGADRIQVDVMDGHFVPNLTFGPLVVEAVRRATSLPIEAHLMIERPELFIEAFVKSGATLIEVQVESTTSLYRTVQSIKELGAKAGVAINPATPLDNLREILPYVDMINVMTVEPGFGGQKFIARSPEKISRLRAMDPQIEIEVDGGIDAKTAPLAVSAGATVLVAGNSVFGYKQGVASGMKAIRQALV
jgi:ribulose-phosphate 3-epimerase